MNKKNKTLRNILVVLIPLLLAGILCLVTYLSRHIPMNPPGTIGNSAGNINNGGLFCSLTCSGGQNPPGHLAGKVPRCLEPKTGTVSEALWLLPVPEAVIFCTVHSHLCRLLSEESWIQGCSCRC